MAASKKTARVAKKTARTVKAARKPTKPTKFDELKTWARKPSNQKQARNVGIAALIGGGIGYLVARG